MSKWYFVPESWQMSAKLRRWTKQKGLTDAVIEEELESFRDHQFKRPMQRADACWRNWVKNGIRWGRIEVTVTREYRTYDDTPATPEEKAEEQRKWREDMERLKRMRAK